MDGSSVGGAMAVSSALFLDGSNMEETVAVSKGRFLDGPGDGEAMVISDDVFLVFAELSSMRKSAAAEATTVAAGMSGKCLKFCVSNPRLSPGSSYPRFR